MTILEKLIQDAKTVPKTIGYKIEHKMELTETELEEVYTKPKLAYYCAKNISGTNIAKLEDAVLSSPQWSYLFARDVPGANITKLEDVVLSSPIWSYHFARYIPGANIEKLEESINKNEIWWNKYKSC